MIAMTTGARINEICQLGINDIKKEKNIWYYDLNDEEETKSLKTIKSKRKVPIHSIVLEQGFLEFVKYMKSQKSERLFTDLTYREDSNYSQKPKNFYSEYIRDIGITDPKKTFHSFRHLFKQMMEKSKIRTEVQNAICGWEGHNNLDYDLYIEKQNNYHLHLIIRNMMPDDFLLLYGYFFRLLQSQYQETTAYCKLIDDENLTIKYDIKNNNTSIYDAKYFIKNKD